LKKYAHHFGVLIATLWHYCYTCQTHNQTALRFHIQNDYTKSFRQHGEVKFLLAAVSTQQLLKVTRQTKMPHKESQSSTI
jgi:hypothetical protein